MSVQMADWERLRLQPDGGSGIRRAELAHFQARLTSATEGHPAFVLVSGAAGMGKTTLLRHFLTEARHVAVLRASGEESEALLRYGIVEHLVGQTASGVLAGLRDRSLPAPEPFVVGGALLSLLSELQEQRTVVVVIDDVQWADVASQLALLFAFRRLTEGRVLVILTVDEVGAQLLVNGLRKLVDSDMGSRVDLQGLSLGDVKRLASALQPRLPLSHRFLAHLREHTGGNPLRVRTVLEDLGDEAIHHPSHIPLPPPIAVSAAVFARLQRCSPECRRLVSAAAVIGMRCPLGLARRLAAAEHPLVALQAGLESGVIAFRSRDVVFVDPLVRAAVYHSLSVFELSVLHAAAASLVWDEEAQLRHLAAAATEHDESLATQMADFARRQTSLGAWAVASTSFVEAARLMPRHVSNEKYLLEAVECLLTEGDLAAAEVLARTLNGRTGTAHSMYVRGRLARLCGRLEDAEAFLLEAHRACTSDASPLATKIAVELGILFASLLQPEETRAAVGKVSGDVPLDQLPSAALGLVLGGRSKHALTILESLPQPAEHAPGALLAGAIARLDAGEAHHARQDAAELAAVAGRLHLRPMQVHGLATLALCEYRLGDWTEAIVHAEHGLSIAEDADLAEPLALLHAAATWPLAGRGEWAAADAHARLAERTGLTPLDRAVALIVKAVIANVRSRSEVVVDAVSELRGLGRPGAVDALEGLYPWHELEIEAAIGLGRLTEARTALRRFEAQVATSGRASAQPTIARLLANLEAAHGHDDEAAGAFARARALGDEGCDPFDRAKTQAAHGAFLRRLGRRRLAAAELCAARTAFESLGARPYVERCERELAASGLEPRRRRPGSSAELTPQETSVAHLVAQGKSNRAVAEELVVSVNTIEYHLKNVYAKLGIRSRSQLTLRLAVPGDDRG